MQKRNTKKFKNAFGDDFADPFVGYNTPTPVTTTTTSGTSSTDNRWLWDNIFDTVNAVAPAVINATSNNPQPQYPAGTYPYGTAPYNPNLGANPYAVAPKDNTGIIIAVIGGVLLVGTVITVVVLNKKK